MLQLVFGRVKNRKVNLYYQALVFLYLLFMISCFLFYFGDCCLVSSRVIACLALRCFTCVSFPSVASFSVHLHETVSMTGTVFYILLHTEY